MQSLQPTLLNATFFKGHGALQTLTSAGKGSQSIHTLPDPRRHMAIVSHCGCPDGSWSGLVTAKLLQQRGIEVQQLVQSYPMKAPEIEVGLLRQHGAIQDNSIVMTADIMFDMATIIRALKENDSTDFVLTDHHGGTGKVFLQQYEKLDEEDRKFIDSAIDQGRLIVNVNTMESGASHIFNILSKDMTDKQLMELFGFDSMLELESYKKFMKAYDLTTMQPKAVEEFMGFVNENITLDEQSMAILNQCKDGVANSFLKENMLHFLICYLGDAEFNTRFHFAKPGSDPSTVVAPSFFDAQDPSYPDGPADKNHKVLMKVPENTKKFISDFADNFKDINAALKKIEPDVFINAVRRTEDVLKQGRKVTYNDRSFFAANTQARAGRFVQALVSEKLSDDKYAVLFGFGGNISLLRSMDSDIDLTEVVQDWKDGGMTGSGGGHPEAAGMQPNEDQYKNLLIHCQSAGIPLNDDQVKKIS
ncbi:hypothetical protein [Endozoicomonas sp. ONNA2]|uniref:hypothetical protein n=1 Tax=Endozoicomonas sp. ONNA2 TaxID=2828741 RepID=UPI0021476E92|nr:hypothetical protein [Endozoicomonas sp. ONNA2]